MLNCGNGSRLHTLSFAASAEACDKEAVVKSPIVKHSVIIEGRKTSISLETPFWAELQGMAKERHIKVSSLVAEIASARNDSNLSSAVRIFVLDNVRRGPFAAVA